MSEINIQMFPVANIKEYEKNTKLHTDEQVESLSKMISEFGFDVPIVLDKDHVIIKGHGRTLAAKKLGLNTVPVIIRDDLTDDQVKAARISDNRVAIGDMDIDNLKDELATLNLDMLQMTGFDERELSKLINELDDINEDVFVTDLDEAINDQNEENESNIENADSEDVSLNKAFGFKSISVSTKRNLNNFLAKLMDQYDTDDPRVAFEKFMYNQ